MASARHLLQLLMPPALWKAGQTIRRQIDQSADDMEFAPRGWATPLPPNHVEAFWNAFLDEQRRELEDIRECVTAGKPILSQRHGEEVKRLAFGYVLALAGASTQELSILDYGGNLGEYHWIGKSLAPELQLNFHCKEVAPIAAAGRVVNPDVVWHEDDACLKTSFDLVMFSSSLQHLPAWRDTLTRSAAAARQWLLLSDVPTVRGVPTFVSTFRSRGVTTLYNHFNHDEVVAAVEGAGLPLVHEFEMGPHPTVRGAPEQPRCRGYLFQRASGTATSGA